MRTNQHDGPVARVPEHYREQEGEGGDGKDGRVDLKAWKKKSIIKTMSSKYYNREPIPHGRSSPHSCQPGSGSRPCTYWSGGRWGAPHLHSFTSIQRTLVWCYFNLVCILSNAGWTAQPARTAAACSAVRTVARSWVGSQPSPTITRAPSRGENWFSTWYTDHTIFKTCIHITRKHLHRLWLQKKAFWIAEAWGQD